MNPLLQKLQPYPFERLRKLFADVTPNPAYPAISLGIGEPKHPTPPFIQQALADATREGGLAVYPATLGTPQLRASFTGWVQTRYGLTLDPATTDRKFNRMRPSMARVLGLETRSAKEG